MRLRMIALGMDRVRPRTEHDGQHGALHGVVGSGLLRSSQPWAW